MYRIVRKYDVHFKSEEGRPPINGRVVIGALIIKHLLNLSGRETVQQIQENVFMQFFLGYSSFTNEVPFSRSLFVSIRVRLSLAVINEINDIVIAHGLEMVMDQKEPPAVRNEPEEQKKPSPAPSSQQKDVSGEGKPVEQPSLPTAED